MRITRRGGGAVSTIMWPLNPRDTETDPAIFAPMSGFVGDLTPQQEDALRKVLHLSRFITYGGCCLRHTQLRSALRDVEEVADKDDHYFLRWLRARKFNVAQAEDMLRKVCQLAPT